jgi:hypothetical protein
MRWRNVGAAAKTDAHRSSFEMDAADRKPTFWPLAASRGVMKGKAEARSEWSPKRQNRNP